MNYLHNRLHPATRFKKATKPRGSTDHPQVFAINMYKLVNNSVKKKIKLTLVTHLSSPDIWRNLDEEAHSCHKNIPK